MQNFVCLFYYFIFEKIYVLKSKNSWVLLSKNINANKNEKESKMENSTFSFREMNLVLQLIYKLRINSKILMS